MATVKSRHGETIAEVNASGFSVMIRFGRLGMILSANEAHRLAEAFVTASDIAAAEDARRKAIEVTA